MTKTSIFCLIIFPVLIFAQNDTRSAAQNLKKQQMEYTKGNFTSFSVPHQDLTAWAKFNGNTKHPEFGRLPYNAAYPGYVEVLEKRQVDERYFVNEKKPTEFHVQKAMGALHRKINNQWLTIDTRLTDVGNGIFEAANQFDPVGFDVKNAHSYVITPYGTIKFNNWKLYGTDDNGAEQLLAQANWSSYTAGEDGIYVNEIFPGIDAQMQVYRGSVKTDFIIKKLNYASYTNLLFKDEFKTPGSSVLQFFGDATTSKHAVSPVYLMSGKTSLLEIGEAIAYPQNGSKDQKILVEYFLEGSTLVTSVPVSWIQQYVNKTHVIIDPLVSSSNTLAQGSITGSQYNASCNFTNSCNQTLVVNTPANATFTDVLWSFAYIAQGICFLEDGACRFTTGACISPNMAGFYWYCNQPNPGTCTGTNISIFPELSPCLPAPSCAPQAVTFTMQFFRACWGANNCGNACIGANSPWIMTIRGQTVDFTNPGSPFTVSANTICFGQNISVSTATQYGVPVHTVNWSFSATGTPSVGSGLAPTITFPAPGTYTLYCIVTDGCAQTTTANQIITVNPIPTLTVTPSADPICIGQSSTLNASGASTYVWSANAGGGTGTSATVTPPVGTTVYTVTGTAVGCSNTGTVSVTVNPLPIVTASSSPLSVCAGQTATLTAGGATTYTWSANAGSVQTSTTTVTPNPTDTYTVIGTDANGCVNSAQVTFTVTPAPTLTTSVNTSPICAGQLDTISVIGATTYTWSANAGSVNTSTASVNPSTTTTYTVTGDLGGCITTETVVVTVTPLPSLTVTAAPANLCSGGSTTLTATGATTFTWSANAGSLNTSTVSVSPGITETYTLSGTQTGCSDSITITIVVGSQPVVTASASSNTICSTQSTTLTAGGATTYTWSTGSSSNPTVVTPSVTTTYTVIGDNAGCTDTTTIIVTVNPTPSVTANASPANICSGSSTTLTATGATTFTWMPGSVVSNTISVSPGTTQVYTVTGDILTCTSTQTVSVNVTATPTLIVLAPTPTVCSGQSAPIIAGGATSYTWSANAGSATTQTVIVSPTTNPTTYTVTGAIGTCTSTGTVSIGVVTTPTVIVSSTSAAICAGQSNTLTASGTPNFTWTPGGANTPTISVSPAGTTTYTVTGDNAGCTATQTIVVTVNALPTLAVVLSQTVCAGSNVSAINFVASGGATVGWTNTNINIGVAASGVGNIPGYTAPNVISQETGVITAIPADALTGCVGTSQTFTIVINPSPTITGPAIMDSAKCGQAIGDVTGLTASGGTPGYTYTWYNGSTIISGATSANLTNVNAGTYSLVVTDTKSCKANSGPYVVGGSPAVVASFTASPTTGTAPLNVAFTNLSTGATAYNWTFGNATSSAGTNPTTIYAAGGTYNIVLTASNAGGCISTFTLTIIVDQAIIVTVPNVFSPNGDNINDEFFITTSGVTNLNCEIFNRWGQKVYTIGSTTQKWDGKLDNGNSAADGTYYYVLKATSYDGKQHDSEGSLTLLK